jgi:CPA1 family monovalent cation:H+ antiporter
MAAILICLIAIVVLVALANRIGVAYPIVLVLGGMAIGFIPHVPAVPFPPDLVLLVFLPPLLYWESITAPTSEFLSNALWIFQLAFGLVVITMLAVAFVAHAIVPGLSWGVAFVLGAIVSSTDELAFASIADRLNVPRHIIGTIEGESLINDATSLILYAIGIAAVVGTSFSLAHAAGSLVLSVVGALAIGLAVGGLAVLAWHVIKDDNLQGAISIVVPFVSYLPAYYVGASGVLAVVTTGIFVNRYTPSVLRPRARELITGFWVTLVFIVNAFIFVAVGINFHEILAHIHEFSGIQLIWYAVVVSATCIVVRVLWVFAQGLLPATNEPEHVDGEADWSHVAILAWTGMRGGVSLAAALAIPLTTAAGPFPHRDLVIFLTFGVLLATLVGQGGTLPALIRRMKVVDDGADEEEERVALTATARVALARIDELEHGGGVPPHVLELLRKRFVAQSHELGVAGDDAKQSMSLYRNSLCTVLEAQRREAVKLRAEGKIDNTVFRRIQRALDLETARMELLGTTGQSDIEG